MQKHAHVSVKAAKKPKGKSGGKISHMTIHGAQNGFMSQAHRMPGADGVGDQEQPMVHPNVDHLVDHVRNMAPQFAGSESSDEEAAEEAGGRTPDAASN